MNDAIRIKCWSCHEGMTLFEHGEADGMCPCCGLEVDISEYLDEAIKQNIKLEAEAQALREERDRIERNRDMWKGQCERQAEKLEALRARFVVPDGYALVPVEPTREMFIAVNKEDDKAYAGGCDHGAQFDWLWDAALEAAPRLNGKAVSEGLLRKLLELIEHGDFSEGHCMCGSAVDSHGIGDGHAPVDAGEYYAGQVMEELRALLGEGKEVSDVLVRE